MRVLLLTSGFLLATTCVLAQETINYDFLGLSFEIPQGWVGEEGDDYYALQKANQDGYVILLSHEAKTLSQLEAGAHEGLQHGTNSALQINGELSAFGENGIQVDMTGIVEWTPMDAFAVALLSPHGKGVVVLSLVGRNELQEKHRDYAREVATSVQFSKAVIPPVVEEWRSRFDGRRVVYANTSGGISDSSSWTLCGDRFWYYASSSAYSETEFNDGSVVSSSASGSDGSQGSWTIEPDDQGGAVFVVTHEDGKIGRFSLERSDGKTYLNGSRYFVVAADCS